jgi:hypothetical protein
MTDDQADQKSPDEPQQDPIRGAFLARQTQAEHASLGGAEGGPTALPMGSVYLSRLAKEAKSGTGAVGGSEDSGGAALRSVYAARSTPASAPAPRAPAPRAPARKAAAKKTAPKKAAKKTARKAAPKRIKAIARGRAKHKVAPPARRAKQKAKSGRRRR